MHPLSAAELLQVWEHGQAHSHTERALGLLQAACPELERTDLAKLSVGQRDGLLLTLREWTFGSQIEATARCPACAERLEMAFSAGDIRATPAAPAPHSLSVGSYSLQFRPPSSADLLATSGAEDSARDLLLRRCLLEVRDDDTIIPTASLPPAALEALAHVLAEADPQADVRLSLVCPACDYAWQESFDIVAFFWCELGGWVERLLHEVHSLARAYGWREADILALSAWRRHYYLDLVSA
jgi:hypothetical protein